RRSGQRRRIRLEAQDTALSRRRSPVRIRYAVPPIPIHSGPASLRPFRPEPGISTGLPKDHRSRHATAPAVMLWGSERKGSAGGGPMRPSPERRLVILTEGQFQVHNAKTALGVMRYGPDPVVALLDSTIAGRRAS